MREQMQCCGVFGYDDWRQDIPDSCSCYEAEQLEGRCQVVNYNVRATVDENEHPKANLTWFVCALQLMMFQMRKSVFRQVSCVRGGRVTAPVGSC